MNNKVKSNTSYELFEFIQSESMVEYNSMYKLSSFLCIFILMIPKVFILIMISNFTNLIFSNIQIIIFNNYCFIDIIFLLICFAIIIFIKEKTKYDYIMFSFFKFYFPISANFILFLYFYIIPKLSDSTIMYTILVCFAIYIINSLTILIILKNFIYSNHELIINFFFFLLLNTVIFLFVPDNRSYIIEVIKIIYYIVLLFITKHYSEIYNKVKLLKSSNQSFYKLIIFFNRNLINHTILIKKDPENKILKIYENTVYDFFLNNENQNDISLSKLIQSLRKIKENRKINLDNNDEKNKNRNFQSKFSKNVNKLDRILELKEDDFNEDSNKIVNFKQNKLVLKDDKLFDGGFTFSNKVSSNNILPKVQVINFESLPNKVYFSSENNEIKLENSFDNMVVKSKINKNLNEKISNNLMISLIENYDYNNLENKIRSFIQEKFSLIKTINFNDLISKIINSNDVKIFSGLELGPFNAYFEINLSQTSTSFLISFKIQHLDFLKELSYIILIRDLEQLSKFIINENDMNPITNPSAGGNLIKKLSSKDNLEELKSQKNFTDNIKIQKEFSIYSKNENSLSEIFKRAVYSSNSLQQSQIKNK